MRGCVMLLKHFVVVSALCVALVLGPVNRSARSDGSFVQEPTTAPAGAVVYTKQQATRGSAVYDERCATCHGADFVPDEFATGLTGVAFDWRWKDRTVFDLYESIRTTMPPDETGSLGPQTTVDIVAYLLQVNKYEPGQEELPPKPEILRGIQLKR